MRTIAVTLLFACCLSVPGRAEDFCISRAETLLVKQEYAAARCALKDALDRDSANCEALYLLHAIEQTEILDYEAYSIRGDRFMILSDSILGILQARLPSLSGSDSVSCLFYIANVYGGKSVLLAKTGNLLFAIKDAVTSVSLLKEVLSRDSTMVAAGLGIGVFQYYLSKSFKWLPYVDANSEKEGIGQVEMATNASYPYGIAAKNSLCWILLEKKALGRADSIAISVLKELPDYTVFIRIRCMIALWNKQYGKALSLGERLARLSLGRNPVNWSDFVLAHYAIAQGNEGIGKRDEAVAAIERLRTANIPQEYKTLPPVKKNLRRISALKKKIAAPPEK
jgi:hypothetical protein